MPAPIKLPFNGAKLRELRETLGLSQRELAEEMAKLGRPTPQPHLCRLERGDCLPTASVFRVLAKALGCNPDDLLGDGPEVGAA